MSDRPDVLLTLIAPAALEENIVDLLLAEPELARGFTTSAAEGHGAGVTLHTVNERVRGRGRRLRVEIATSGHELPALLERLRAALPGTDLFFWTTSLLDCGTLP